ncbi:hypothetical protein FOZ61_003256 [Perkinsus olseni]|nr:hypothetical protein FOZ61_003256 [Perkinsus olseni]
MPPSFHRRASRPVVKSGAAAGSRRESLRQDFPRLLSKREQDFLHRDMERELMEAPSLPTISHRPPPPLLNPSTTSIQAKFDLCLDQAVKCTDEDLERAVKNVFDVVESLPSRGGLTTPDPRMQALLARVTARTDLSSVDTLFYTAMLGLSVGGTNCDRLFEEILSVGRVYEVAPTNLVRLFRARSLRTSLGDLEWQILASMVTNDIRLVALVPLLELLALAKVEEATSWELALGSLSWLTLSVPEFLSCLSALKACPDVELAAKHCARAVHALDDGLVYELLSLADRDSLLFTLAILKHRFESRVLCPHPLQVEVADGPARLLARRLASDMNLDQAGFPRMCRVSMALVQLGRLPDWTVKAIEKRLASPRLVLLPSAGVQPTDLLSLMWALHRWPNSWRRRSEWGAPDGLGAQLHMALRAHLTSGTMSARMLLTAVECLASITTRKTKPVLLDAMREAARLALEGKEDLTLNEICMAATTYTVRLQFASIEPQTTVAFLQLLHQRGLSKLTTPQLADLCEVHSYARIVMGLPETLDALTTRLADTGGLIAPAVAARVLVSGAKMQAGAPEGLMLALAKAVNAADNLHPRVAARSLWGITAWLAGRQGEPGLTVELEKLVMAVASRESMETVLEHRAVSGMLWQALSIPHGDMGIRETLGGYRAHLLALDHSDEYNTLPSGPIPDIDGLLEQAGLGRTPALEKHKAAGGSPPLLADSREVEDEVGSIEPSDEFKLNLALAEPVLGDAEGMGGFGGAGEGRESLPELDADMRQILGGHAWRQLICDSTERERASTQSDEKRTTANGLDSREDDEDLDSPKDASYLAGLRAAALKRSPRATFPKLQGLLADILSALKVCQRLPRVGNELEHEWHRDSGGFEYLPRLHEQFDLDWLHKGAKIGIMVLGPRSYAVDDQRHLLCDARMSKLQFEALGLNVVVLHSDLLNAAYDVGEAELKRRVKRANRLPELNDDLAMLRRSIDVVLGVDEGRDEITVCAHGV